MHYTLSSVAYWTMVMHAARYPQHAISGVLLGKKTDGGVTITGAVALFHTQVLAPMLEVALIQVDAFAKEKDSEVVGWYRANERVEDLTVPPMHARIASKLFTQFPSTCLLLIDNARLTPGHNKPALQLLTRTNNDQEWKVRADELAAEESEHVATYQVLASMLKERRFQKLNDFDAHLEDPSRDWLNEGLFA